LAALAASTVPFARTTAAAVVGDLPAVGLDGRQLVLKSSDIATLSAALRGELITAHQAGYDAARRIWNAAFDRKPALIVRCAGTADVRLAVRFAAAYGLLTAVRAGGHSFLGQSSCDGGLVIDLSPMRGVRVDPVPRKAHVDAGTLIGRVDRATQAFGLATPLGDAPETGVAGLTLGGGLGWLRGRFGLTADNVLEANVVTADGSQLRANAVENPDLYWALKGGGGNYGVVTSFTYLLHEVPSRMLGGTLTFPFAGARELLRSYAEICMGAPDDLSLGAALTSDDNGTRVVELSVCYSGLPADAERAIAPLRKLGKPLKDALAQTTYLKLQGSLDPPAVNRRGACVRGGLAYGLSSALIDNAVDLIESCPVDGFDIEVFNLGGCIGRVPAQDTAYWDRGATHAMLLWGEWKVPGDGAARNAEWVRGAWKRLAPHVRGHYANFPTADGDDTGARVTYGGNYARLAQLKRRYDPSNLFRLNANIEPAA
jgi:FAD/FMN-containing dehydrogenase